jgi:hypothetical protein
MNRLTQHAYVLLGVVTLAWFLILCVIYEREHRNERECLAERGAWGCHDVREVEVSGRLFTITYCKCTGGHRR